ncbi:MAG: cell envelope integrity protein TolA [Polaromonas sp.]|uniref:cell envelope integrity protein TolA n=1 Tax=Polaromonas sp. TaxID=1869339 RepID=UPI002733012F|nr:cell envelope integrity protein TolA [Polaromonas sp.]MDP1956458.1 cell envelope integrity protein TolA [Polaromonas sp.]MDP3797235.1 cell envelope integrity protein TolA [Polaromonas sp.]
MTSTADRLEFAPQRDAGALRAFGLALLVHMLLIGALTWGVNWKHSDPDLSFEAELWSSAPQEAAPKEVEAPPPPPPPPPAPEPPQVKAPPPPPAPDVDIAIEREKKRKLELKKKEEELAKAKAEQDRLKELQAKKDKEQKAKEDLAKRKAEEAKKAEDKKLEAKQDAKDAEKKKMADAAAEKLRQENIRRAMGLAGATGAADAKGSAQKASGPSASYGGKVRAKVKPNIVFTEDISGNPTAEVEVRTALDGSIISQRLIKSSGNKAWDEAVIKAILRTETMPRDVDGRVPTPMILEFRPKD